MNLPFTHARRFIFIISFLFIINSPKTIQAMEEGSGETQTDSAMNAITSNVAYTSTQGLRYPPSPNRSLVHRARHILEHVWNANQNAPLLDTTRPISTYVLNSFMIPSEQEGGEIDPIGFIDLIYSKINSQNLLTQLPGIYPPRRGTRNTYSTIGQISLNGLPYNVSYVFIDSTGMAAKYKLRIHPAGRNLDEYPVVGLDRNHASRRLRAYVFLIEINNVISAAPGTTLVVPQTFFAD